MSGPISLARTLRGARRLAAQLTDQARLDAGLTHEELGDLAQRSRHKAAAMCHRDKPETWSLGEMLLETVPDSMVLPQIAKVLDARGCVPPAKRAGAGDVTDDLQALSSLLAAQRETEKEWLGSIGDDLWEPHEARAFITASQKLRAQLVAMEERVKVAIDRVDRVRRTEPPTEVKRMVGTDRGAA